MTGLDATMKSIIKETVKSQFIKKEAMTFGPSLLDCELTFTEDQSQTSSITHPHPSSSYAKRNRQPETVDLSSPQNTRRKKKQDSRPPHLHYQGFICLFLNKISK